MKRRDTMLVVWFLGDELRQAKACHSKASITRTANSFNEYGLMWQRMHKDAISFVALIDPADLLPLMRAYSGLPKRKPRKSPTALERAKKIFKQLGTSDRLPN